MDQGGRNRSVDIVEAKEHQIKLQLELILKGDNSIMNPMYHKLEINMDGQLLHLLGSYHPKVQ